MQFANSQRIPPAPYGDKPMTEQQAAAAQARLDAATPRPWEHDTDRDHDGIGWSYVRMPDDGARPRMDARHNDAAFIAAAPTDLALALSAIRRVRELERQLDSEGSDVPDAMHERRRISALLGDALNGYGEQAASKPE